MKYLHILILLMIPVIETHSNDIPTVKNAVQMNSETVLNNEVSVKSFDIPRSFKISQNYPNPFNASTTIEYELPTEAVVYIAVYNTLGRVIKTLVNRISSPGKHKVEWNGKNNKSHEVGSGVYFFLVYADDNFAIRKMLFLK